MEIKEEIGMCTEKHIIMKPLLSYSNLREKLKLMCTIYVSDFLRQEQANGKFCNRMTLPTKRKKFDECS